MKCKRLKFSIYCIELFRCLILKEERVEVDAKYTVCRMRLVPAKTTGHMVEGSCPGSCDKTITEKSIQSCQNPNWQHTPLWVLNTRQIHIPITIYQVFRYSYLLARDGRIWRFSCWIKQECLMDERAFVSPSATILSVGMYQRLMKPRLCCSRK